MMHHEVSKNWMQSPQYHQMNWTVLKMEDRMETTLFSESLPKCKKPSHKMPVGFFFEEFLPATRNR